jgi:hypothetical protein
LSTDAHPNAVSHANMAAKETSSVSFVFFLPENILMAFYWICGATVYIYVNINDSNKEEKILQKIILLLKINKNKIDLKKDSSSSSLDSSSLHCNHRFS